MHRIIFISLVFISTTILAQTTSLKLASDVWPPFTNIETEKSLATDIVDSALARIHIDSDMQIVGFDNLMRGIRTDKYDGSAALWLDEERKKWLLFSDAYLQNQLILVGRKGSDVDALSLSELSDVRIGIVKGYSYGESLDSLGTISFIYGESDQQNLEKLLSEKVDCILVDAILIQYLLKYQVNDVSELLEIGKTSMITKSLHFAIRKEIPGAEKIIADFNSEIIKMIADGSYNEILELNWIKADIDGDGQMEMVLIGDKAGSIAPSQVYSIYTTEPTKGTNRYYIEGKVYNGWNNIPERYKKDAMQGAGPSPSQVGFRL